AVSGTSLGLRSRINGTQWMLVLATGAVQFVQNVDVKDSNAGGGIMINDYDGTDSGNNTWWNFSSNKYWVNTTASNWSTAANWANYSGGPGGAGAPGAAESAIFDGNGRGNCNIDTNITISTLTISTSTAVGYNNAIDASTHTIVVSSFTMNKG